VCAEKNWQIGQVNGFSWGKSELEDDAFEAGDIAASDILGPKNRM